MTNKQLIAEQNDIFRREGPSTVLPGQIVVTRGIATLPHEAIVKIMAQVQLFNEFPEGDDPHGHHDFGSLTIEPIGVIYWIIDYYDDDKTEFGAEDPTSCFRVLTVMKASEY